LISFFGTNALIIFPNAITGFRIIPADSNTILGVLGAGIVNPDDNEDVLELTLDVRDEWAGSRLLKIAI